MFSLDLIKSPSSGKKLFEMQKQLGIRMRAKRAAMLAENVTNLLPNKDHDNYDDDNDIDEDDKENDDDDDSEDSTSEENDANSEIVSNVDKENVTLNAK